MREHMRVSMQNANGSDGALKTMMAKLLSQKLHRTVHAVVWCKHLGDRSGDCNLSRTL